MKRFVSLFLVVVLVFALVGCGKNKKQIIELTLSTEDSEAIMAAAGIMLPDVTETTAANTTVKWFSWWDSFHNYRDDEVVNDLAKNQCIWPRWNHGWALRNETEGAGMKEGLCLFYIRGDYVFTGPVETISAVFGDVTENELMFVPLPRDPNGDGYYYTESSASGYCIVKGATNPEGVALLASCDRFKVLDPTVINIDRRQKEEIYLWTDEMLNMWDECYRLSTTGNVIVTYDAGIGDQLSSVIGDMEGCYFGSVEPQTWAQLKEANNEKVKYYIDELNKQIDEFDPDATETQK